MLLVNLDVLHIINAIYIFHNLQGYDGHIICKEINNFDVDNAVIPKGIAKYISIIVNRHITFIDSLQFYNGLLDTLALL